MTSIHGYFTTFQRRLVPPNAKQGARYNGKVKIEEKIRETPIIFSIFFYFSSPFLVLFFSFLALCRAGRNQCRTSWFFLLFLCFFLLFCISLSFSRFFRGLEFLIFGRLEFNIFWVLTGALGRAATTSGWPVCSMECRIIHSISSPLVRTPVIGRSASNTSSV